MRKSAAITLTATALLCGGEAYAISLPIDGTYGSGSGCRLLSEHGMRGLVSAGGTDYLGGENDSGGIIVSPRRLIGPDWTCQPLTVDGPNVALECMTDGATWMPMPIATVRTEGGSLLFTFDDEPTVSLRQCDRSTHVSSRATRRPGAKIPPQ